MAKKDMFDDVDSGGEEEQVQNRQGEELKINEEFAKRFEYNKKREEKARRELHPAEPINKTRYQVTNELCTNQP
jgi:hypothetical protein